MSKACFWLLAMLSSLPVMGASSPERTWTLLYEGRDRLFQPAERRRLGQLLRAWGIEYRVDPDGAVRVAADERKHVLDLLQRSWTQRQGR